MSRHQPTFRITQLRPALAATFRPSSFMAQVADQVMSGIRISSIATRTKVRARCAVRTWARLLRARAFDLQGSAIRRRMSRCRREWRIRCASFRWSPLIKPSRCGAALSGRRQADRSRSGYGIATARSTPGAFAGAGQTSISRRGAIEISQARPAPARPLLERGRLRRASADLPR